MVHICSNFHGTNTWWTPFKSMMTYFPPQDGRPMVKLGRTNRWNHWGPEYWALHRKQRCAFRTTYIATVCKGYELHADAIQVYADRVHAHSHRAHVHCVYACASVSACIKWDLFGDYISRCHSGITDKLLLQLCVHVSLFMLPISLLRIILSFTYSLSIYCIVSTYVYACMHAYMPFACDHVIKLAATMPCICLVHNKNAGVLLNPWYTHSSATPLM